MVWRYNEMVAFLTSSHARSTLTDKPTVIKLNNQPKGNKPKSVSKKVRSSFCADRFNSGGVSSTHSTMVNTVDSAICLATAGVATRCRQNATKAAATKPSK